MGYVVGDLFACCSYYVDDIVIEEVAMSDANFYRNIKILKRALDNCINHYVGRRNGETDDEFELRKEELYMVYVRNAEKELA